MKTALDLFIEQLEAKGNAAENSSIKRINISIDTSDYIDLKIQAKEMEKEQIVNAHYQGYRESIGTTEVSEQYYEQTYGGHK